MSYDQNYPQQGQMMPGEYEEYMQQTYGPDWKTGFRVGFGKRLGALIIDVIITMVLSAILFLILPYEGMDTLFQTLGDIFAGDIGAAEEMEKQAMEMAEANIWVEFLGNLIMLLYWTTEIFFGWTLGKKLLKIKIADTDLRLNKGALTKRFLIKHSYSILGLIILPFGLTVVASLGMLTGLLTFVVFIGCFFALGANKQALHDMIAGTAVFNEESLEWSQNNG